MTELAKNADADERREFPRVSAPIYCRPAHRRLRRRKVVDVGLGGMRVYSDEPFDIGARFEVELFLEDRSSVNCLTEVMWIRDVPGGDPAAYDIGLKFLHVPEAAYAKLDALLGQQA
ncbi:MAG: PilZ domain-containing protein [Myxococcota bacterium]